MSSDDETTAFAGDGGAGGSGAGGAFEWLMRSSRILLSTGSV